MTVSGDLAAFLASRLDEDEVSARRNIGAVPGKSTGLGDTDDGGPMWPDYQTFDGDDLDSAYDYLKRFRPLRMLREVAAGRAILELHAAEPGQHPDFCWHDKHELPCLTLRIRAAVYSDHPDYRQGWKP